MRRFVAIPLAASLAAPALAAPGDASAVASEQGDPIEVVVTANPWARWEHTRWRVDTQVGLPYPVPLYAAVNQEVQVVAVDLSLVVACELGDTVGKRVREADCVIQDAAVRAAPWLASPAHGEAVLRETDERLTGLQLRLQVTDDGEIATVGLHGEPEGNRRSSILYENLRQLVSRAFVGFHMQVPPRFELGRTWYERNSRLFSMPAFRWVGIADGGLPRLDGSDQGTGSVYLDVASAPDASRSEVAVRGSNGLIVRGPDAPLGVRTPVSALRDGRNAFDMMQAPASLGFSVFGHRMDLHKGRYVVQSRGEGSVDVGLEQPVTFKGTCDAASVFDPDDAVMTERIWTLTLSPTAGSVLAEGPQGWSYWHLGRLTKLTPDEHPNLGATGLVGWPGLPDGRGQLAPWPSLP